MSVSELVARTNFGIPIENIRLNFKLEQRHFKAEKKIMNAGLALYMAEAMQGCNWYLTDENFLVCGEQSGLPVTEVEVVIDNDAMSNQQWLVDQFKRFGGNFRPHTDGFRAYVKTHPRRNVRECFFGVTLRPTKDPYEVF